MSVLAAHWRTITIEQVREPSYFVISVLFPPLLFLFLGIDDDRFVANRLMASFATFAFVGVMLFSFASDIAKERESAWETLIRTLPVRSVTRVAARVVSALILALVSALIVALLAETVSSVSVSIRDWLRLVSVLVLGSLPIGLLGTAIGYATSARAATSIANLLYVLLSFGGGLWIRPRELPGVVESLSGILPSRAWAELSWASVQGEGWAMENWGLLAGYSIVFGFLALRVYANDEGRRYT